MLNSALPELHFLAVALALLAVGIWVGYIWLISRRFREIITSPTRLHVTGRILLSTVSTQAIVVVAGALFPGRVPGWLSLGLIALGYFFYVVGLVLIVQRYLHQRGWRLADDWDNTNCIIHGAMSITGLAALQSGAVPDALIVLTWVWAAVIFSAVESLEIARMRARVRAYGWQRGVLTYNVSQWARNFTFGMLYVFTAQLYNTLGNTTEAGLPLIVGLQVLVVAWGQYVVLFLLLVEVALFLTYNISIKLQTATARYA